MASAGRERSLKRGAERITLDGVAKEAGVSLSTVSRAVRDEYGVSPDVRTRVLRAARKLNYVPNLQARSLALGRTNLIGLVTPPVTVMAPHLTGVARIESLIHAENRRLIHFRYEAGESDKVVEIALEQHWDGALIFPNAPEDVTRKLIATLAKYGIPSVVLSPPNWAGLDYVTFDRAHGVRLILDHAAQRGVRTVAVMAATEEIAVLANSPKYCFLEIELQRRGMELAGLIGVAKSVELGPELYVAACDAMNTPQARALRPDLLMAANDTMAVAAINCLIDRGLRVPQDVAVTGFDDAEWSRYVRPSLTTVRLAIDEMVELGWNLLKRRLAGEGGEPQSMLVLPSLVVRQSTER